MAVMSQVMVRITVPSEVRVHSSSPRAPATHTHLRVQVELGVVQRLAVAVLGVELRAGRHAQRLVDGCALAVLVLHRGRDLVRLVEEVQRVDGEQVHARQQRRVEAVQQLDDDVVRGQPRGGEGLRARQRQRQGSGG